MCGAIIYSFHFAIQKSLDQLAVPIIWKMTAIVPKTIVPKINKPLELSDYQSIALKPILCLNAVKGLLKGT